MACAVSEFTTPSLRSTTCSRCDLPAVLLIQPPLPPPQGDAALLDTDAAWRAALHEDRARAAAKAEKGRPPVREGTPGAPEDNANGASTQPLYTPSPPPALQVRVEQRARGVLPSQRRSSGG